MDRPTITTEYLAERRTAVAELKRRLAAGENEAVAAHALGFATRNDVHAHIAAIVR
jgi:hypothetical protein